MKIGKGDGASSEEYIVLRRGLEGDSLVRI